MTKRITKQLIDAFMNACRAIHRTTNQLEFPHPDVGMFFGLLAEQFDNVEIIKEILLDCQPHLNEAGLDEHLGYDNTKELWVDAFNWSVGAMFFDKLCVALKNRVDTDPAYKPDDVFEIGDSLAEELENLLGRFGIKCTANMTGSSQLGLPKLAVYMEYDEVRDFMAFVKRRLAG